MEGIIDKVLKAPGGIGQTERHHLVFKMAISCSKHGFPFLSFGDSQVVVPIPGVKPCIPPSIL